MEPVTFIVSAFWLMTGLGYYLLRGSDFEYTSVYHAVYQRKLNKLMKKKNLSEEDIQFLESYLENLKRELTVISKR